MQIAFLSFLFLFISLLNYCHCQSKIVISLLTNTITYPKNDIDWEAFASGEVTMEQVTEDRSVASVNVTINYTGWNRAAGGNHRKKASSLIKTGTLFTIARYAEVKTVTVTFAPLDTANYVALPSVVNIFYAPSPIERLIPPNEQAAVAQTLAISGKVIDATHAKEQEV